MLQRQRPGPQDQTLILQAAMGLQDTDRKIYFNHLSATCTLPFFFFFFFLGLYLWHMGVPSLGVELEL